MKKILFISFILLYSLGIAAQDNPGEKGSEKAGRLRIVDYSYENYVFKSGYLAEHFYRGRKTDEFFETFTPNVVPEYFFLGTLNPLPERKNPLGGDKVDSYRREEKPFVEYLENYFQQTLNISLTVKEEPNHSNIPVLNIYSPELMEIKRTFFDPQTGALKEDIFHTDEEIASYLLGVYFRYGRKVENEYYQIPILKIYIGMEKMFYLLVRLKARKVIYLNAPPKDTESLPEGRFVFDPADLIYYRFLFEPSQYLEKYLDTIKEEKKNLPDINL